MPPHCWRLFRLNAARIGEHLGYSHCLWRGARQPRLGSQVFRGVLCCALSSSVPPVILFSGRCAEQVPHSNASHLGVISVFSEATPPAQQRTSKGPSASMAEPCLTTSLFHLCFCKATAI
ncbi:hypothetical protein TRVL_08585 [Trypanosoma vivax]|nr:hypothetical protein TRVL_08585 [Trypanosoma vivax]